MTASHVSPTPHHQRDEPHRLPPGQRRVPGLPRFGTHLHQPPPPVPIDPTVRIEGAVQAPFEVPLAAIASLPRVRVVADFHCVAGWTATGLAWAGVRFADFYREVVEPAAVATQQVSHLVLLGLDGYRCVVGLEDVLADDVLLADELDGEPLDGDHGAPLRLVSPAQYGYVSVKHLSGLELHVGEPHENFGAATRLGRIGMVRPLFARHPRSRVWHEERNAMLPAWAVRPLYRLLTPPIAHLSAKGARGRSR